MIHDGLGNELSEQEGKNQVTISLPNGELTVGKIMKVDSGLGIVPGSVIVAVFLSRPVAPDGTVIGAFKA